eukprot:CAMPEP_0172529830 /NCGR_PEP_ID=MMETSP1067-20121228/3800_1 /TAXON_ID=265564 ORGANISM="Thalassiosira punctigera, Strain Tpunct2005C2" /NCGR_SAMPLE_ID=MMETSP1067 /ASSEMBLY_ACC=CAM_ASM_000444 /LENGTH=248 /DNA_ID=CAMNT_0013313955 /DNA_START=26 /DNA_END=772 /DNA_ORIENTATION=+
MAKAITVSITAQTKIALHAAKHAFSDPIHGIVLGKTADDGGSLNVVDVVPVCHEVPTKPIVDVALRLTDAYLQLQQQHPTGKERRASLEGARIVGWYTANANASSVGDDEGELPNPSACRIVASMAECGANNEDGNGENFVLLLVSTSRLAECVKEVDDASSITTPICKVFEKDKSRAFTQKVDDGRVLNDDVSDVTAGKILSEAMQQISEYSDDGGICDFVDHLADFGEGDWIENRYVNQFVLDSSR